MTFHQVLSPRPFPNTSPLLIVLIPFPVTTVRILGSFIKGYSLSGNEDAMTLQNVYDLCISLCKQVSDQAKEIKLLKAKITKLKKKANPVIKHFKAYQKRISKEQRQQRKHLSKKKKVQIRFTAKKGVSTDFEKVSTDRPKLSTDDLKVSTDEQMESNDDQVDVSEEIFEGTEDQKVSTEEQSMKVLLLELLNISLTPTYNWKDVELLIDLGTTSTKDQHHLKPLPKNDQSKGMKIGLKREENLVGMSRRMGSVEEKNIIAEEEAAKEALIKNFDDVKKQELGRQILAGKPSEQEKRELFK
ncbi:hypothetical protein Tco_0327257 [Tanacetum coccineum]